MNHQDTKTPREPIPKETDRIAKCVVDAAYAIHTTLGPGLIESIYEICLAHEIEKRELKVKRQVILPIIYDNIRFDDGLRLDMVIQNALIVELKAVETILPVHYAQILTYLKLSGFRLGLLINFNVNRIKEGIKRIAL
ncbi:MAG: GxxExxY protein [bacterium]